MEEIWLLPESKLTQYATLEKVEQTFIDYDPAYWRSYLEAVEDVAIININNVIAKYSWGIDPRQILRNLQMADAKPQFNSKLLYIDSPGGEAVGIELIADAIYNGEKPTVVYCENMESGAKWIGSQADYIVAWNEGQKTIGSIGAYRMYRDYTENLKQMGIKISIVRAPQSKDKIRGNAYEPITAEIKAKAEAELSELMANHFIPGIERGRGKKLKVQGEEPFTGLSYTAQEALEFGLIDQIGTLEDAFQKAKELGAKYQQIQKSSFI